MLLGSLATLVHLLIGLLHSLFAFDQVLGRCVVDGPWQQYAAYVKEIEVKQGALECVVSSDP